MLEKFIALMSVDGMVSVMDALTPQLLDAMPLLFPILLPGMMPTVLPHMVRLVENTIELRN